MLELVSDVPNYHMFLPWVKAVRVWNETIETGTFDAELLIGYRNFRAPFTTKVKIDRAQSTIQTSLVKTKSKSLFGQPMRELECKWKFIADGFGCMIELEIDYIFNDRILAALLSNNIEKASQKLIEAFTNEAKRRYS